MVFGGVVALAAQLAFVPPVVRGEGDCPSAAEVATLLGPLLPAPAEDGHVAPDVVELASRGAEALVRLVDREGGLAQERALEAASPCAERARQAAVLVATWEADLHADVTFPPLAPSPPVAILPLAPEGGQPAPAVSVLTTTRSEPPHRPEPLRFELKLGGEVFMAAPPSASPAPAGLVEGTWSRGGTLGARLSLSFTGSHALPLEPGSVAWRRAALGLGAMANLSRSRVRVALRADGLVAAILASGTGFSINETSTSWQLGVDVGVRAGVPLTSRLSLWADVGLAEFPGTQRVAVLNIAESPLVPSWEAQVGLGASWSIQP